MSVSALSSAAAPLPTFTQPTAPMIGAEERQILHHISIPFPYAGGYASFAGGEMYRLSKAGVPKNRSPKTGKWVNVGGTTYKKLLREGKLPAVPASSGRSIQPKQRLS